MSESKVIPAPHPAIRFAAQILPWITLVLMTWLLRYFWPLIFITFILGSFMFHSVERVSARLKVGRRSALVGAYLVLVTILILMGSRVVPVASREAAEIANNYLPKARISFELFVSKHFEHRQEVAQQVQREIQNLVKSHYSSAIYNATKLFGGVFKVVLFTILSIIFSFLVLLDLRGIEEGLSKIRHTRVGWIFEAIVPPVVKFFTIVGLVFDAQIVIAFANSVLTAMGLVLLGVNNVLFLTLIVFFCGWIPVLGVFISSTPILLVAFFQDAGGVFLALKCLSMVLGVHALEAYVLNPRIMGDHLKVHPFTVLITLLLGEHYFGLWGVLMGVPIVTYISHRVNEAAQEAVMITSTGEVRPSLEGGKRLEAGGDMREAAGE